MKLERVIAVRTRKSIYRDGDAAVKVFDESYPKANVLHEALNLARVEQTELNVPHVREVTGVDGKWAIVTDFIEGKTLETLFREQPEARGEWLEKFVELQMQVHNQRVPDLDLLTDKMQRKISQCDLDATTRYDLHTRLNGMPVHRKLCHGDFCLSNVILTPDNRLFILDWAHATQGNASADAARTYLRFWLDGEIGLADKYLNLYCEKSGTPKSYVQKWMPIVAASQSVKGRPEEREFLLQWAQVVDYE